MPKKQIEYTQMERSGVILTPALVLSAIAVAAAIILLAVFVNPNFWIVLLMGLMCFGRFTITGSCPLIRPLNKLMSALKR